MDADLLFVSGYVIPKSLSKQEIDDLFDKFKNGDLASRNLIIEHNLRLVLSRVNGKFADVEYDKKDLLSNGIIGLIKAVDTFDISRGTSFSTYAIVCIDREIIIFIRKIKKKRELFSLDEPIYVDETANELNMWNVVSVDIDVEDEYIQKETYSFIRELVNNLSERDRKIIIMYFGFFGSEKYTQQEIAEMCNCSQVYVSKIIKKVLEQFKRKLEKQGIIEKRETKVKRRHT